MAPKVSVAKMDLLTHDIREKNKVESISNLNTKEIKYLNVNKWHHKSIRRKWCYLFTYFWPGWVFVAAQGLSLVAEWELLSGCSVRASRCRGFCCRARVLGREGAVVAVRGLSCSAACGIFLGQGSNRCPCMARGIPTTGPPGKPKNGIF